MTASLSGVFSLQEFTDAGLSGVGYRVYTYITGTTTFKTAYTDAAGLVPHTYTADGLGGQYIALNARGELPAPLFLSTGSYDITLKRADGSTVWTRQAVPGQDSSDGVLATLTAFIASIASTIGSSLMGFLQAGLNAVLRTAQDKLRETVDVADYLPIGYVRDGSVDYHVAIQAAINALFTAGGGTLHFPNFTLNHGTTPLVFKNNITFKGKNRKVSKLIYTGTTDQIVIQNTLNGSTDASINIEDLWFSASSLAAFNGNLFDTGSSLLSIRRCTFDTSQVGLILDQTELGTVAENYFSGQTGAAAGVWLVNGADKNVGSLTNFTNRLAIRDNQFNGTGAWIGVVDDGGDDHTFATNNFNAGTSLMRISSVTGFSYQGGQHELWTGSGMLISVTKWKGGAGFGAANLSFKGGFYFVPGTNAVIDGGGVAGQYLSAEDMVFNTAGNPFTGLGSLTEIFAKGNQQGGAGSGVTAINNYFSSQAFTVTWTGAGSNPVLGNGTLTGNWSRHGRRVEAVFNLTAGTTTTFGTGNWSFSLPTASAGVGDTFSASMTCAGGLYGGIGRVTGSTANSIFTSASSANAAQSNVPAAWAANSGNTLQATVSYLSTSSIG